MPRSLKQGKAEGLLQGQATHTPGWRDARLHLDRTRPRLGSCEGGWGSGLGQRVAVMPSALDLIARPRLWKAFVIWLPGKVIGLAQIKSYKKNFFKKGCGYGKIPSFLGNTYCSINEKGSDLHNPLSNNVCIWGENTRANAAECQKRMNLGRRCIGIICTSLVTFLEA